MATAKKTQDPLEVTVEAAKNQEAAPAVSEEALDAVIVVKKVAEDGSLALEIVPNGKVQPTEIETLLGLGLKQWRQQLGV